MIEAYRHAWAAPLLDAYNRFLLRRAFARIRVANFDGLAREGSLIAAPNHCCWWDGAVDLFLARRILRRRTLLMMGDEELSKYRIFSSMGVFSIPMNGDRAHTMRSVRYAVRQLREHAGTLLWMYPQGVMLPARAPFVAREGALLIAAASGVPLVPVARRYEFLRDDHPEVIVRVGEPLPRVRRGGEARGALETSMRELLARVDADVACGALDEYEEVFAGAETRSDQLQRLRRATP